MQTRNLKIVLYALILFVVFASIQQITHLGISSVIPRQGTLDLMGVDLSEALVSIAAQEWEYYPAQLYTPEDFAAGVADTPLYGDNENTAPFGTYRLTVTLAPGEIYSIAGRSFTFAQRAYIGDQLMEEIGTPGTSRETTVPHTKSYKYSFAPQGEQTELVFQVANFHHRRGGRNASVILSAPALVDRYLALELFRTVLVVGSLLSIFLYFTGVFIFFSHRLYHLFFGLSGLAMAVRILTIGRKHIMLLFPGLSWFAAIRLEYICHILFVVFLYLYIARLYPGMMPRALSCGIVGVSALYVLAVLFGDTLVSTYLLPWYTPVWGVACLATLYKLLRRLSLREAHTAAIFIGILIFTLCAVYDEVAYLLFFRVRLHNTIVTGMLVCIFMSMLALLMGFSDTEIALSMATLRQQELDKTNRLLDQLNTMKTQLMANISHEMKTPLTVMSVSAQLCKELLATGANPKEIAANLDAITTEAGRLARMMGGVLELGSLQETGSGDLCHMDIAALLRNAAKVCRVILEKRDNVLQANIPRHMPPVNGNADMLMQVMINLLSNANRYTQKGVITIAAWAKGGVLTVEVSDTGTGIAPELLPRIFERHVTDAGGAGLGLSICKSIAELHGGEIQVAENPGGGTVVRFTLPVCEEGETP